MAVRHRIFLVLLAAMSLAGVFAVKIMEDAGSPVGKPTVSRAFSPDGDTRRDNATITLQMRERGRLSIWIEREDGRRVRTISRSRMANRGVLEAQWDGRDDEGRRLPDGQYRGVIRLEGPSQRTFRLPRLVSLDTTPPSITSLAAQPGRAGSGELVLRATLDGGARRIWAALPGHGVLATVASVHRTLPGGAMRHTLTVRLPDPAELAGTSPNHITLRASDPAGNTDASSLLTSVRRCPDGHWALIVPTAAGAWCAA